MGVVTDLVWSTATSGDYDWRCNWIGNLRWSEKFEWTGHLEFAAQVLKPWKVDDKMVGLTRGARGLTYATVQGAGHMVSG